MAQKNIVQETFNNVAGEYDSKALRFFSDSAKHLASIIPLRGHDSVIDIATGTGNVALAVASYVPRGNVTGIDFSGGMLEQAKKRPLRAILKTLSLLKWICRLLIFLPQRLMLQSALLEFSLSKIWILCFLVL